MPALCVRLLGNEHSGLCVFGAESEATGPVCVCVCARARAQKHTRTCRKLSSWAGAVERVPWLRSADKTRLVLSLAGVSRVSVRACMHA
jgi:hypothetical protein